MTLPMYRLLKIQLFKRGIDQNFSSAVRLETLNGIFM